MFADISVGNLNKSILNVWAFPYRPQDFVKALRAGMRPIWNRQWRQGLGIIKITANGAVILVALEKVFQTDERQPFTGFLLTLDFCEQPFSLCHADPSANC